LGEDAREWRAEAERRQPAEEEKNVSRRSKEDRSSATCPMGESKACEKE